MFVVTVLFEIDPAEAAAFLPRVARQARESLDREPGCRRFDVCLDPERPEHVFLYEMYDDSAAFDAHRASEHLADFSRAIEPMVRAKTVRTWTLA